MRRLSKCCCFSARTGAIILAVLGFMGGVMNLGINSFSYSHRQEMDDVIKEQIDNLDQNRDQISPQYYRELREFLVTFRSAYPHILIATIALAVVTVSVNVLLMWGVISRKSCMIIPWLVYGMTNLVLSTVFIVGIGVALACSAIVNSILAVLIFEAIMIPILLLCLYFWFVVRSVYLDVKEGRGEGDQIPFMGSQVDHYYKI